MGIMLCPECKTALRVRRVDKGKYNYYCPFCGWYQPCEFGAQDFWILGG
jgi:predicted RNA-binding Zn-ribbon protein involved in translation (DUF1610 family)